MAMIEMHEADAALARLVARAEQGETVIIAKDGKPVARLVPVEAPARVGKPLYGFMSGNVPDDFDRMFEDEIAAMFNGD